MKNNKREMLLTSLVCLLQPFALPEKSQCVAMVSGKRKRLVIACRHCVRPAAVYFGTASRLLLRREP